MQRSICADENEQKWSWGVRQTAGCFVPKKTAKASAATRDRTGDLQIFSLTLSQLSYSGDGGGHDQYTVALAEQNG